MYVVFENDGEMDQQVVKTFGISVKNKEQPIGYFGTGLKYAIAILLREQIQIAILSGAEIWSFERSITNVRGTDFEVVKMNGELMPFTTRLGINWKIWQAFRELYCNCLDESGSVYMAQELPKKKPGKTFVVVQGAAFVECFDKRHEIVLNCKTLSRVDTTRSMEVFDHPSKSIYYRGVRVMDTEKPTMYSWNILDEMTLTEDRTFANSHYVPHLIGQQLTRMTDKKLIHRCLTSMNVYEEFDMNFYTVGCNESGVTPEFWTVLQHEFKNNSDRLNRSARTLWAKRVKASGTKYYEPYDVSVVEEKMLERARTVARRLYTDFDRYPIKIATDLGEETMALADRLEKQIIVSSKCFNMGTKFLTSTLIEEYIHIRTGYDDNTRSLQTYLLDTICSLLENHVLGEPI